MWVKMALAAALLIVNLSVASAQGDTEFSSQRNTDVPKGPAVWPLINSKPQTGSQPSGQAAPNAKDSKEPKGGSPATDTTGATGKSSGPERAK
jgi:hypothetical protein